MREITTSKIQWDLSVLCWTLSYILQLNTWGKSLPAGVEPQALDGRERCLFPWVGAVALRAVTYPSAHWPLRASCSQRGHSRGLWDSTEASNLLKEGETQLARLLKCNRNKEGAIFYWKLLGFNAWTHAWWLAWRYRDRLQLFIKEAMNTVQN